MPVLTNAQIATLQRVLATTNNVLPRLEMLESLANVNVAMKPRVQELRTQREYLAQLATAALEIERQLGGAVTVPPVATSSGMSYSPPPPPPLAYSPPMPQPMPYSPPPAGPQVGTWNPAENVPSGTRRFIRPLAPGVQQSYPSASEQAAGTQYGWYFESVAGESFNAIKQ